MLVETRATRPPWPKPQGGTQFALSRCVTDLSLERGLSKSRDFVGSDLRQAGGSSVPNPPLSTSLNPGGERTSGRRLRKQPSGTYYNRLVSDQPADASQRWLYLTTLSREKTCSSTSIVWKHRMTKKTVRFTHTQHI